METGISRRNDGDPRLWVRPRLAFFAPDDPAHVQARHDAMATWLIELAEKEMAAVNAPEAEEGPR